MRQFCHTFILYLSFVLFHSPVFAHTLQPKSLFFRIDLKNNVAHFGHFIVKNRAFKAIETKKLTNYTETDVMLLLSKELDATVKNHKALVFIHGMWGNRSWSLKSNIPEFEENYGAANDVVIHIIWESESLNERVCRRNARNSNTFITPILRGILNLENVSSNLMCHSMGNYLLFELMDELQDVPQPFEKIFLMAPDVALPVFVKNLDNLECVGKTTEVYYNKKDLILFLSGIANREQRLGKKGTTVARDFIQVTDCTKEKNYGFIGRMTQHSYFKRSPVVRESLKKQINS